MAFKALNFATLKVGYILNGNKSDMEMFASFLIRDYSYKRDFAPLRTL